MSLFKGWPRAQTLLAALILTLLASTITAVVIREREQNRIATLQAQEFYADLLTNGFDQGTTVVTWEEETDCRRGTCETSNGLIATTIVAGCRLQLERNKKAADHAPEPKNGVAQMKWYWLDEYDDGSEDGTSLTEGYFAFTWSRPPARLVHEYIVYLKDQTFSKCYDPTAPVPKI